MTNNRQPSSDEARRALDRDSTGEAKNARGDKVENELDQETYQLQRDYDANSPKHRH